jgi:hypothetical protein
MMEWFFLDGVDTESARTAVGRQDNRIIFASPNEAETTLAFMKTAEAGTDIASDTAIVEKSPVMSGVTGHTERIAQGKRCGPENQNRT